jgi:hypothetical protein
MTKLAVKRIKFTMDRMWHLASSNILTVDLSISTDYRNTPPVEMDVVDRYSTYSYCTGTPNPNGEDTASEQTMDGTNGRIVDRQIIVVTHARWPKTPCVGAFISDFWRDRRKLLYTTDAATTAS